MAIGIGVIGCGVRGQHSYELALAALPRCEVRAVSQYPDVSPALLEGNDPVDHARTYAARLGAEYHDSHLALLAREDVQVVSLMCEPAAAPDLVDDCCRAGKHIVRDKPMCLDLQGADRIVAAVEGSRSELLLTLGTRFSPTLAVARERLAAGDIGTLLTATFTYLQAAGPLEGFTASAGYLASVGGGELTNFGHYAIDYLLWLAGAEVETVYATTGSYFYPDYQAVGMEDLGQINIRFANGVLGTVITGRTTTVPRPESYFRLDITGTAGSVQCDSQDEYVTLSTRGAQQVSTGLAGIPAMLSEFLRRIEAGEPSPIGARDGREVLRVLTAAYASAREGQPVAMDSL